MFASNARRLGACAMLSLLSILPIGQAAAHWDDAYYHDYHDLPAQSRWMGTLHDSATLGTISMPGTHGSAARHGGWISENQTLTISQQLSAGIRFLDLRTRHYHNRLELHHGIVYQFQSFPQALDEIVAFLQKHPTETVVIRVKEEGKAEGNSRPFGSTINSYFPKYGKYFATRAELNSPLKDLRGKIVLFKNFADTTGFGNMNYHWDTIRQDDHHLNSNWDLYWKWEKVKAFINATNQVTKNPNHRGMPFINFLSGSGGALPYFVASGHSDTRTGAPGLVTGKVTPFFNDWHDFPRGACFIGMCTIYFEGTNTLTKNYLRNPHIQYAGIIAADFPGAGLIQAVIDVNRTNRPMISATNGQCLDIEYGLRPGSNLITWPCHGGANQRFTVRGEQIMVGGYCLDVAGNRNVHMARVVARPCHGGQNQRWKVQDDGTIRSRSTGPPPLPRPACRREEPRGSVGLPCAQSGPAIPDAPALRSAENKKGRVSGPFVIRHLVGETGFEPATSTSRT